MKVPGLVVNPTLKVVALVIPVTAYSRLNEVPAVPAVFKEPVIFSN